MPVCTGRSHRAFQRSSVLCLLQEAAAQSCLHCDSLLTSWTRTGIEFVQSTSGTFSAKVTSTFALQWIGPHKQPKTCLPSYRWGNESRTNTVCDNVPSTVLQEQLEQIYLVHTLQRAAGTCWLLKLPCTTALSLLCCQFSFLVAFFSCFSIIFTPHASWEIISIIPAVVLHHTEHNQS